MLMIPFHTKLELANNKLVQHDLNALVNFLREFIGHLRKKKSKFL